MPYSPANDRDRGVQNEPESPVSRILRSAPGRLLLIPLLVFAVWVAETFFFQGRQQLFLHPDPFSLLFYTLMTCIFVGIVLPVILVRQAFLLGDVNMHQLGFRPLKRTLLMVTLTILVIWLAVVLQNPFGPDRMAFLSAFLLLLPTGLASAMVCYVLAGTHMQALVRERGVLMAILAGSFFSAILFALTLPAHMPGAATPETAIRFLSAGILASLFFFAVRDVWAVSLVVTGSLVWLLSGWLDPAHTSPVSVAMGAAAVLTAMTLAGIQWYLSRHYVTIAAPVLRSP